MRTRTFAIAGVLLTVALVACSKDPQPTSSEIEQALTSSLPAFARVSSFSVDAMQNMGTQVEPIWQSRFRATVKVTAATFAADGADSGVVFVRTIKQTGETTEVFGKSVSRLYAGQWRTAIDLEGQPIPALGQPESAFGPQKVIIRGSKDETAYITEQSEKQRLAGIAAQREAEAQRVADERANEDRRRVLANARQLLVGTWRDENSLETYAQDGSFSGTYQGGTVVRGTWAVEGDTVIFRTLERDGKPVTPFMHRSRIVELTAESFVGRSDSGKTYHATRVK